MPLMPAPPIPMKCTGCGKSLRRRALIVPLALVS